LFQYSVDLSEGILPLQGIAQAARLQINYYFNIIPLFVTHGKREIRETTRQWVQSLFAEA